MGAEHVCTAQRGSGNSGVILQNVSAMREEYPQFMAWLFSPENVQRGFSWGGAGPCDQGALNTYFEGRTLIRSMPLFNWKPYWGWNPAAAIVHFVGPKPGEIHHFQRTGQMSMSLFAFLLSECKHGKNGNGCTVYVARWFHFCRQLPSCAARHGGQGMMGMYQSYWRPNATDRTRVGTALCP